MRVAALFDIHGNLPALDAVLAEVKVAAPDLLVVGGDFVMGPMPRQTLERLRALGDQVLFVRGNNERYVIPYDSEPGAYWALLGPDAVLKRTHYDVERAAIEMSTTAFPMADEFARQYFLNKLAPSEAIELFEELARQQIQTPGART